MEENQISTNQPLESKSPAGSPNFMLIIVVVAILAVFGFIMTRNKTGSSPATTQPVESMSNDSVSVESVPAVEGLSSDTSSVDTAQTITVESGEFYFKPNEIRVKKGEPVKIIFNDVEGFHDFVIDEFNVKTPQIQGPNTAEVTFTPDTTGSFEFYCSVGKHRAMGMKGTLIVE